MGEKIEKLLFQFLGKGKKVKVSLNFNFDCTPNQWNILIPKDFVEIKMFY